jgi:superfamily II RNA helicase
MTLGALLPRPGESLGSDQALERFLGYAASSDLQLYAAQEEALLELYSGKHVILNTPTGSGKSLVATALHYKALTEDRVSFYTCPIKALVNEKFFALCNEFGAERVGMLTGDAAINQEAKILCCTAEILANRALRDPELRADYVVMDEFHYYADRERGVAWQVPLLSLRETTFLLMSATLGDTGVIERSLKDLTGREVARVMSTARPVPLDFEYRETPLHETIEQLIASGRAPIYLVNFTQRAAAEEAQSLLSVDFSTKAEKEAIKAALEGSRFDTPYGKDLQRFVRHGVGLHHAGLLPKYRLLVEKLAQRGLLKVVSGTDTLGMGINIPLKTVLFTQLCKYDGEKTALLTARDFHQIAGRAGRKGFDDRGGVVAQAPEHVIENLRLESKKAQGKKVVKRQPPQKGYVPWDRATFERLQGRAPEPLESRFDVTHGMVLHLLANPLGGYDRLVALIARSHGNDYAHRAHRKRAAVCFRSLRAAGLITVTRREGRRGSTVAVAGDLQEDFSLNQTLSMYLIAALETLDRASETYAFDVLTLVESILENPQVVLFAQLDRLKTEKLDALKAAGVEYAERMEELDKVEWPKPMKELIYTTFNAFADKHPWVGAENVRPKSIARDMLERFCSFHDYVREYGLQRSEGVLLRYLSQAYKTLLQTVPETARTEEVADLIEALRLELHRVDSSLLDEWEGMTGVVRRTVTRETPEAAQGIDKKALEKRVRGELHRLLGALGRRQYDDALPLLAPSEPPWTAQGLEALMAAYFAEHPQVILTPEARRPQRTRLKALPDGRLSAQQTILDPDGDGDWMLDCEVASPATGTMPAPDRPLLILRAIRR